MGKGVSVEAAKPTAEETALAQKQVELAEFQLEELRRSSTQQQEFAEEIRPLLESQATAAERALAEDERLAPIREELLQLSLEDLRRGPGASPEQQEAIEAAISGAQEKGEIDIDRFEAEGFEALREELAPSLGLRPGDTPILDRGGRVWPRN